MPRIALRIAYQGQAFQGWQTQPSRQAVQDHLEAALTQVAGHPVGTICAGRTDAGVHALAQVVHFDASVTRPLSAWIRGVNAHLPAAVAVQQAAEVSDDFHARYGALRRHYRYLIHQSPVPNPFRVQLSAWVHRRLDVGAMAQAAQALLGKHDFSAFRSAQCQAASPVRTLERLELRELDDGLLLIDVCANAFLHHMVRNLVGALVWVGWGRRDPDWLRSLLACRDRRQGAPTMAAQGLYLAGVEYPEEFALGCWPPLSIA